jgi:two-component system chemotaxis response regulator CheB
VEALISLCRRLPEEFPAAICVVLHIPSESPSLLAQILEREGTIEAKTAEHGEVLRSGTLYVAPPDRHFLIERGGVVRLSRGPRENRHRPAIDPLFRSAAIVYGEGTIGVVLTGSLDDGTVGLLAVKRRGGITVIQDPDEALYPSMPRSALENVDVDHVVPLAALPSLLERLLGEEHRGTVDETSLAEMQMEERIAAMDSETMQADDRPGTPSAFSCPDCGGVLWEVADGELVRYRCRVGHAYSPESMLGAQSDVLEEALWEALKTLEESARLAKRLADAERKRGHDWIVKRFEEREADARARAEVIRQVIATQGAAVPVETQRRRSGRR